MSDLSSFATSLKARVQLQDCHTHTQCASMWRAMVDAANCMSVLHHFSFSFSFFSFFHLWIRADSGQIRIEPCRFGLNRIIWLTIETGRNKSKMVEIGFELGRNSSKIKKIKIKIKKQNSPF